MSKSAAHFRYILVVAAFFAANSCMSLQIRAEDNPGIQFFEAKIRPLLADACYACHSVKAKKVKGGLLVDSLASLVKGGESGTALVPGTPEKSRLVEAIEYKNQDLQMPPESKLSDAQIADLKQWVKMGAPWPTEAPPIASTGAVETFDLEARKAKHWAWKPISAQVPPSVKNAAWVKDPIDAFILKKLEDKQLTPAPIADKAALLRRTTFDLTGMPPTPAEIDAFVSDNAPNAFEKVVDRLLASPRYGEHWARHWFDLVRYAESHGHEFDFTLPNAYQYRDYVIRALNAEVPYNKFAAEHIAGDLLEKQRMNPVTGFNESRLGTGFFLLGEDVHSPVDVRQHQADRIDNMIDVTSKTFLGLTLSCARCHDHKFDAIPTADYYSMYGFLKSSRYSQTAMNAEQIDAKAAELSALKMLIAALAFDALKAQTDSLPARLKEWKPGKLDAASPLIPWVRIQKGGPKLQETWKAAFEETRKRKGAEPNATKSDDFEMLSSALLEESAFQFGPGFVPGSDPKRPVAEIRDSNWLASDFVSSQLQGSARTRTFKIEKPFIHVLAKGQGARVSVVIDNFTLIRSPIYGGIRRVINSPQLKWLNFDVTMWVGHEAYLEINDTSTSFPGEDGHNLKPDDHAALRRVVFSNTNANEGEDVSATTGALRVDDKPVDSLDSAAACYQSAARAALEKCGPAFTEASPADAAFLNALLENGLLDIQPSAELAALVKKYQDLEKAIPAPIRAPAVVDGNGVDENIFIRGGPKNPGPKVARKFLTAFNGAPVKSQGSGRLELAREMTDPNKNPLFTRVIVNRLWHHMFGRGIVATVDNFGELGARPTHPELLDFLATRFADDGYSIKTALKKLVMSNTYQMDSVPQNPPDISKVDPANDLLSRQRIKRLSGEEIRDGMLSISGRLNESMFGPSVNVHLTEFMTGRGRPAGGPLDGEGRRSLYTAVRRNFLPPMMLAFDAPTPFSTMGRRSVSNVPAQALILLNDPFVIGQAELWAQRELKQKDSTPAQHIRNMYRAAFVREATEAETKEALAYIETQMKEAGASELSAWKDFAHVLFNVKEFIFIK